MLIGGLDKGWLEPLITAQEYLDPNFFGFKVIQNKKEVDKHYVKFLNSRKGQNKKAFSFRENFFELQFIDKYYSLIFSSSSPLKAIGSRSSSTVFNKVRIISSGNFSMISSKVRKKALTAA